MVPSCLKVTAIDEDNNPEVIEAKNKKFYIGVKFHPELLKNDIKITNLFKLFIQECKKVSI